MAQQSAVPSVPLPPRAQVRPQYIVVLDAAHGGTDSGARLSDNLFEKDVALALALRLRAALDAQGIQVVTTRDSDAAVPLQARAEAANHALAEACITLHATGTGTGVHLFTSSLAPAPRVQFLPWRTAQAAFVTQSLRLSSEINAALAHVAVPVILGRTSLQPMDSFACPAVAVEVANAKNVPLTDAAYQKKIVDALTSALTQWKNDWRPQP
ncbi:MAG TPA: N-acetylmuramoyl-L-alanine amidase [Pseudacidobacterium sp.]|nr:N-acetylmuramoyl-L-alanine amidase [Pseudacidobacterium sp.]